MVRQSFSKSLELKLKGKPEYLDETEYLFKPTSPLQLVAKAKLPTKWGLFTLVGFYESGTGKEHTAIVKGAIEGQHNVPLRVHSQCHTGDVLGSLRCDCQAQLEGALQYLGNHDQGVVLYLMQEGRGIGLLNKIKAYQLQDLGLDTIEANVFLGFQPDERTYEIAAQMIRLLQIKSIHLMTNNPKKIDGLKAEGIDVRDRISLVIPENPFSKDYLKTKKNDMGHMI